MTRPARTSPATIEICDETLRDGSQAEGVAFSVESKLRLLQELDRLGVDFVVGGWPFSNAKDIELFDRAQHLELTNACLVPFGSTRRKDRAPEDDPNLRALLATRCTRMTLFGKSWGLHATEILGVSLPANVELISSSVAFLVRNGVEALYDAEHFFDGMRDDDAYALETLHAAAEAGAARLILCDTNGGTLPDEFGDVVARIVGLGLDAVIGVHAHNDSGVAVANTIAGVRAGATHVQGTLNGYGERCGNANLCAILPILEEKMGYACLPTGHLQHLTAVSRLASELANQAHDERQPFVGRSAFAHKGGIHIDAARKNPLSYEHIEPERVGNKQRILISDQAGRGAIVEKLEVEYPMLDKRSPQVQLIYEQLKEAEALGYEFEAADASFFLLAQKALGEHRASFELHGFRLIVERFPGHEMRAEATIKVREPNGLEEHTAAEGNGPVNALDNALRKALEKFYPSLRSVTLTDYNVRVLDSKASTEARVRVLIQSSDGEETWSTVGVSENIIQASWYALVDSLEYKIFKDNNR